MKQVVALALLPLAIGLSCGKANQSSSLPDHSQKQKEILELIPGDSAAAVTIVEPAHLLERLSSLEALAKRGPAAKQYLDRELGKVRGSLQFDPLRADAWREQGINPTAPIALFFERETKAMAVLVQPTDLARARALIEGIEERLLGRPGKLRCGAPSGKWLLCTEGSGGFAGSPARSLFPLVTAEASAGVGSSEVLAFITGKDKRAGAGGFWDEMRSVAVGIEIAPDRIVVKGDLHNPASAKLMPYLKRQGEPTLLGVAAGATAVARLFVSPKAVWQSVRAEHREAASRAAGGFQMATGLDLERELIENLTGEILSVSYGPKGAAWLIGTRDDAQTRKLAERIDAVVGGAITSFGASFERSGWKSLRSTETIAGRPAYVFRAEPPKAQQANLGAQAIEAILTTTPGGLVVALDRGALERVHAQSGRRSEEFSSALLTPEARQAFESEASLAAWGLVDPSLVDRTQLEGIKQRFSAGDGELGLAIIDALALLDLVYDGVARVEVKADCIDFDYQLTLL